MSWFNSKKINLPEELKEIKTFNIELSELLQSDNYIARKDFMYLFDKYKKVHNSLEAIKDAGLLNVYSKKNNISKNAILDFIENYNNLTNIISDRNKSFVLSKMYKEKVYLDNLLKDVDPEIILDEDQRKVILTDEDYSLVIAGAGAGKTTTIAGKVKYLVDKKNIDPKQILIISFTNKAVGELKDKINNSLKIECPITTFHSAGNAILRKKSDEKANIVEGGFLYNTVKDYFLHKLKDKRTADNIILFFGNYFDNQYEGDNKQELFNSIIKSDFSTLKSNLNEYNYSYIQKGTNKRVTLNNEVVNSIQEVQIANFLYLNGIDYEYEPNYPYYIVMSKKRYTPDFVIKQNGKEYYLEHFGISENGQNNRYTNEELEKYKKAINDKVLIHKKHNTKLMYTFSQYNDGINILEHLKQLLFENGIELNPKPSEEVLRKLLSIQENKYVAKMVYLICDFINNFKVNGYKEEKFYDFIRSTKSERTKLFLEICRECYLEYQRALATQNAVDFQDMINEAARALKEVDSLKQKLDFKYIIIDEYQDISRQRFDMAKELSKVTSAKIIAVGDDWQSIFAFSGSDVTLFTQFCKNMGYGEELKITRTYRNAQEIIDIAGGFIQKNDNQIKKSLMSPKHIDEPVIIVSYDDDPIRKSATVKDGGPLHQMAKAIEYAIGEIVNAFGTKASILLIGRYGYDGAQLERTNLFNYIESRKKVVSKKYPDVKIDFLTAHSSKGLGYDNVIIINAKDAVYGFPSKIEDDPVMKLVIKQHNEMEYAEERRLFYVALTRTKNKVYLIAPEKHPSQFVLELIKEHKNVVLKGDLNPESSNLIANKVCPICGYPLQRRHKKGCGMNLWICTNEPEVCGFLSNNLVGGSMSIQKCTQCLDGYLIVKTKNSYPFLGCTNYKPDGTGCNNTVSQKAYSGSVEKDEIVELGNACKKCEISTEKNFDNFIPETKYEEQKSFTYFSDIKLNKLATDLRRFAEEKAIEEGVRFWKVLRNKAIVDICNKMPLTIQDFYDKKVLLGKEKVKKYGNEILNIIKEHCPEMSSSINMELENSEMPNELLICEVIIQACQDINRSRYCGPALLVEFLKGGSFQTLLEGELKNEKLYGSLANLHKRTINNIVEYLVNKNILYKTKGVYPTIRVNKDVDMSTIDITEIKEILKRKFVEKPSEKIFLKMENKVKYGNFEVYQDDAGNYLTDIKLLEDLKKLRIKLASEIFCCPLYIVAGNKLLVLIATYKPKTKEDFLQIKGIGEKWFGKYGKYFLQSIENRL